jgi:ubiquinone/menaquinone biosynthesis C-methylase UbiE
MNYIPLPTKNIVKLLSCLKCDIGVLELSENYNLQCSDCDAIYLRSQYGVYNFLDWGQFNAYSKDKPSSELIKSKVSYKEKNWNKLWDTLTGIDDSIYSQEIIHINEINPAAIPGNTIIEAGCGPARNLESYLKYKPKNIILCDLSDLSLAATRWKALFNDFPNTNIIFLQSDVYNLPIKSNPNNVYVSCGVLNILPDASAAIKHALQISDKAFFSFNSPVNIFGAIYYRLNPVREFSQYIIKSNRLRIILSRILSYIAFPLAWFIVRLKAKNMINYLQRRTIEFLIFDWIFSSPRNEPKSEKFYQNVNPKLYHCSIYEKTISRIVYYSKK